MADGTAIEIWRHPTDRDRMRARAYVTMNAAIRRGLLAPVETRLCVDCGAPAEAYDHRDYRCPLRVEPVCIRCNVLRGPGLPLPRERDGSEYRNDLKPKGKGIRAAVGYRWKMDDSEGYMPQALPVHTELPPEHEDFNRGVYVGLEGSFEDFAAHARLIGKRRLSFNKLPDFARYEYFKAHDPWRAT